MATLEELTEEWKIAKKREHEANAHRISIESQIYQLTADSLPDKGTTTLESGMKITTGFSEEWDQDGLMKAYNTWSAPVAFPFTGVWKPDARAISYLRDNAPDLYAQIQPFLTIKPKKPSFSIKV